MGENMKEIIVYTTENSTYKVIILDNSVSFVEKYTDDTKDKTQMRTNHYNVPIGDIQRIKYTADSETIKSKTKLLPFILAGLLFIAAIVLSFYQNWIGAGITIFISIIFLILGIIERVPESNEESQKLIVEGIDKILYQKKVQISNEQLFDIINSIRAKQQN